MRRIVLVVHNVRSTHNIGSILRTADGLGIERVYLSGYTPYPKSPGDTRLPHVSDRAKKQIAKTALGAEHQVKWQHQPDIHNLISELKSQGFLIAALEQTAEAINLASFKPVDKMALIVGSEIGGLPREVLEAAEVHISIPMLGGKESLNVSVASAIALYHLRWYNH
jgi:tRNA G18 (ribose-2'-O)-methylase SpoU